MKRITIICVSICAISVIIHADDLYLKDGKILRNVKVLGQSVKHNQLVIDFIYNSNLGEQESFLLFESIERIFPSPYNNTIISARDNDSTKIHEPVVYNTMPQKPVYTLPQTYQYLPRREYHNLNFLAVSALGLVIMWDGFSRAGDYQEAIDANNYAAALLKVPANNSNLEAGKTRTTIMGIVGIVATITSTLHALQPVYITSDGKSLSLAVNF